MPAVCLYFKVHQPYRLKQYAPAEVMINHCYEDSIADAAAINQLADDCYLPANKIIADLISSNDGNFKVSYSISGVTLELLQRYRPDVIRSFRQLAETGCIELLAETYYHSLSSLHSTTEFERQLNKHADLVNRLFDLKAVVFRNTELIYNNELAKQLAGWGLKGVLCEGIENILKGRSINQVYAAPGSSDFGLLLRNSTLSDDIAFRFDDKSWSEHPLTAEKFAEWIHSHPSDTEVINLFMDYETLGVHKKGETGIFDFFKALPAAVLSTPGFVFSLPSEALNNYYPKAIYDVTRTISWEDRSSGNCVWCENVMQNNTLKKIYSIREMVFRSGNEKLIDTWGRLQAADYFYYMDENREADDKYVNPLNSAKEAFESYTNMVTDLEVTLIQQALTKTKRNSFTNAMAFF